MLKTTGYPLAQTRESSAVRLAFNKAAKTVGDWLGQAITGTHDKRREEMFARIRTFPGGEDLLKKAAESGCEILVLPRSEMSGEGSFNARTTPPCIHIKNTGNTAGMAMALWHELRHFQQNAANGPRGYTHHGQLKDARTAHMMNVMIEADAFTAETLMALQQKKAGNPEYFNAMFDRPSNGSHRDIMRFMRDNSYEDFKDDATFARALFTHMTSSGLLNYRASYFLHLGASVYAAENVEDFRQRIKDGPRGGTRGSPELSALYGPGYSAVSVRALATAFFHVQPEDERQALELVEKTVRRAPTLTEEQFQEAKQDILKKTMAVYGKDPDEYDPYAFGVLGKRQKLQELAVADKPSPLPVIWR